jgi:hypothetical protein
MMGGTGTFWSAFLDGFTMRGLFERLTIPGAPTKLFEDSSPTEPGVMNSISDEPSDPSKEDTPWI